MHQDRHPRGFTLVELLVVIAIIGILLGLLLPNLAAVQQTAKSGAQAAIIQAFGKGFMDFSTLDSQGRLSSGAFDHNRDGDMTRVGWVADLVNGKFANPGKSLDPTSKHKVSGNFALACDAGDAESNAHRIFIFDKVRWLSNATMQSNGSPVTDCNMIVGTNYFGTKQTVWDDGFNTNFATTWHFSRGDNVVNPDRFPAGGPAYGGCDSDDDDGIASPLDGDGPLSTTHLSDSTFLTSADKVALLGPSRGMSMDFAHGSSPHGPIGGEQADTINRFIDPTGRKRIVKNGDYVVNSSTDGPNAGTGLLPESLKHAFGTVAWTHSSGSYSTVHEISDIAPHVKAKKVINVANPQGVMGGGYANILFADGSTRRVNDNNGYGGANKGDGWIGPYQKLGVHQQWYNYGWINEHVATEAAYEEVRDELYLGRLRARLAAGGGSSE